MMLLTKELRKKLPKLNDTEGIPLEEKTIIAKFFTPWSNWTWYAVEFDGVDQFFGLVDGLEKKWGYFSLRELEVQRHPSGLKIERDLYFGQRKVKDILAA